MPKNDKNDNLNNSEATQTPAEYTPQAAAEEVDAPVTAIEEGRKRRLGTGAIIGISAASVALLAGVFGSGIAVANVIGHQGGGPQAGGQPPAHMEMDNDGPKGGGEGHEGKRGHGPKGGMAGGPQGGLEADGSMPGNVPHEHDENGNDIIPEGYPTTAPAPATTN
ncbi:MAG: hypothetical protein RI926_50 [Actinomycetota bacterium]